MSDLIESLINSGYLKTPRIIEAFKKIKRKDFVVPDKKIVSEENIPLSIGYGQTISQPLTVALMLELLNPCPGEKILDIGSGSGWSTALLAELVQPRGEVFAIERISELKEFGQKNVLKYDFKSTQVKFIEGDGSKGLLEEAPFDKIHVAAAVQKTPQPLLEQLAINGKMIIPEGIDMHDLVLIERISETDFKRKKFSGFAFVPLIQKE